MFSHRVAIAIFLLSIILFPAHLHFALPSAPQSLFRLPVLPGVTVTVSQGNKQGDHIAAYESEYAFDFKVGQTNFVETASQGGTVIGFNNNSTIQCSGMNTESSPKVQTLMHCWAYANFVLIADDDGKTAALYVHLLRYSDKLNMPQVTCGEHVNQGDPIGLAGTTGYSTGVHLHFQVESLPSSISTSHCQQADPSTGWWWTNSQPITFANPEVLAKDACLSIASNGIPQTGQCFVVSANTPPTTPISQAFTSGTWKGQATSDSGDTFDMMLQVVVNRNTFTGAVTEGVVDTPTYREDTILNGKITGNSITFSTATQVEGILNNYKATVSNGQMNGSWATQDQPPLTGTFTLHKTPANPSATPTSLSGLTPFVGTWYAHSRSLTITSDGKGAYNGRVFIWCGPGVSQPCDTQSQMLGMNTTIMFTSISADGKTISGSITAGTGDRDFIQSNSPVIPVGSQISATFMADDKGNYTLLQVSDGWLGCNQNVSTSDPHYSVDCTSGA
jgi:hypothetical protein